MDKLLNAFENESNASIVELNSDKIKQHKNTILEELMLTAAEKQKFLKKLVWDGKQVGSLSLQSLNDEDQKLIRIANAVIRERSGKGREIKVSQPFASLRLKAGLSFTDPPGLLPSSLAKTRLSVDLFGMLIINIHYRIDYVLVPF